MRRTPGTLGIAAEPVKRIGSIGRNRIFTQERDEFAVGIRLTIQVRDPRDAPFAVERAVFAGFFAGVD